MILHGNIKFKEAIIVDEKMLKELEEVIEEFFEDITYKCVLCNDDKIKFDSLQELLSYENIKTRSIKKMIVSFDKCNEIVFEIIGSIINSYKYTIQGSYKVDDSNKSILFSEKIDSIFKRHRRNKWYTILSKISFMHFWLLFFGISLVSSMRSIVEQGIEQGYIYTTNAVNLSIIAALLICGIWVLILKFRDILFFPISFMIGEQIDIIKKREDIASKIFWGIIIAFIVSFIVAKIA